MKKQKNTFLTFEFIGSIVGLAGFGFFLTSPFESLTIAGHFALAIFWLAAWLYVAQPIPVYATSLLVMLLACVMLTKEGPVYKGKSPDLVTIQADSMGQFKVDQSSVFDSKQVFSYDGKAWERIDITISEVESNQVQFSIEENKTELTLAKNAYQYTSGFKPFSYKDVFNKFASPIIILFLGGFMLARGAVKYQLDTALTAYLLRPFGTKPKAILFGLLAVTAILSAFMSNTATTAMMMTVILPIIAVIPKDDSLKKAIVLSIPIAANIGGIATPIGTPPNAIVVASLNQQSISIPFSQWMSMAAPYAIIMIFISWYLLQILYKTDLKEVKLNLNASFNKNPKALALYMIFGVTILLWLTESYHRIPSGLVAFIPVTFLTFGQILDKNDIHSLSWEVLWLVSGGMALGLLIDKAGVATWLIQSLDWSAFSITILLLVFALLGWALSNFMSNTVTATLMMPLGITLGLSGNLGDGYNMIIASLVIGVSTSIAMVLPISTPPNAIAMSTNLIESKDLSIYGLIIGVIGVTLLIGFATIYWTLFF